MIPIKAMTLHNTFFLAGTNLGIRLEDKRTGLKMYYQEEHSRYVVTFHGVAKIIHESNVADSEPVDVKDLGLQVDIGPEIKPKVVAMTNGSAMKANVSATAQVGDPTRGIK